MKAATKRSVPLHPSHNNDHLLCQLTPLTEAAKRKQKKIQIQNGPSEGGTGVVFLGRHRWATAVT
jgi:hypothetical protein